MKLSRIAKGVKQVGRLPELWRCLNHMKPPMETALVYLRVVSGTFPMKLCFKRAKSFYWFTVKSWEDVTTAWVVLLGNEYRLFERDRTIVDIGANIGAFAIYAHAMSPSARIVSIEPFPDTHDALVENLVLAGIANAVTTRRFAVSGQPGECLFDCSPVVPSHSRKIVGATGTEHAIRVNAKSLEQMLDEEGLNEVDYVKLDVEGAEYGIVEKSTLRTLRRVRRCAMEYHDLGLDGIGKKMEDAGFGISYHPKRGGSGVIEFSRK